MGGLSTAGAAPGGNQSVNCASESSRVESSRGGGEGVAVVLNFIQQRQAGFASPVPMQKARAFVGNRSKKDGGIEQMKVPRLMDDWWSSPFMISPVGNPALGQRRLTRAKSAMYAKHRTQTRGIVGR